MRTSWFLVQAHLPCSLSAGPGGNRGCLAPAGLREADGRGAGRPQPRPPSSPVLDADPEVVELPRPLVFVLPLVPLLLPPELLQLAEAVRKQEVWGEGRVLLFRCGGGGR